jgi:hypothetical protein
MSEITERIEAYASGSITWDDLVTFLRAYDFVAPKRMTSLLDDDYEATDGSVREIDEAWDRNLLPSSDRIELARAMQGRSVQPGAADRGERRDCRQ